MQRRLVKTIQATQVTSVDSAPASVELSNQECLMLVDVAARNAETLELRRAGFSPVDISRLQFLKWRLEG